MFVCFTKVCHDLFQTVVKNMVRDRKAIHRKVALKHTPFRTKTIYRVQVIIALSRDELVRARRRCTLMPTKTIIWHGKPANFCDHIRVASDLSDVFLPLGKNFISLISVGANTKGRAKVIKYQLCAFSVLCKGIEFLILVVIVPGVES